METGLYTILYIVGAGMLAMSLVLFIMMWGDKNRAKRGARRIPEKRLFLFALLGGALGGWAGMYAFRHKTKHMQFVIGFPLIALLQLALCVYLALGRFPAAL